MISPISPYKHLRFIITNLLFSYLMLFIFFLKEVYFSISLDTVSLHSWGRVTWAKVYSMVSKPKTGPKWSQKENIPKQRKYKYFTSLNLWWPKFKNHFYQKNYSHHKNYITFQYFNSQQVYFTQNTSWYK